MKYISKPISSNIHLNHEPFIWPDLTFCNPTAPFLLQEESDVYNLWKNASKKSRLIAQSIIVQTKLPSTANYGKRDIELAERAVNMATIDPEKLKINNYGKYFSILKYVKKQFGENLFKNYERETSFFFKESFDKLFSTQILQHYDNVPCHTLHMHKLRLENQDLIQSLFALINFNYMNYHLFNSSYSSRKLLLYISDKNELPKRKPIILLPGFRNFVRLIQTRVHHTNWKRPCRTENFQIELYDALLKSTKMIEGSSEDCKTMIRQENFVKHCNCYNPFLPIYKNESGFPKLCWNASYFSETEIVQNTNCMHDVIDNSEIKFHFDQIYIKRCKKYEPVKCDEISYGITTDKEYFIELWTDGINDRKKDVMRGLYKRLTKQHNVSNNYLTEFRNNFIDLVIERETEYGDFYEEYSAYPFSELLSDIGGLMGLWMGMSIVGLFEIVECLYLYACMIHKRRTHGEIHLEEKDKLQQEY